MKRIYPSIFFLAVLFFTQKTTAQISCNASFYIDTTASTPFNAVIVNNSTFTPTLTPPDSGLYTWNWGDGTSSYTRYPTHTYTSAGTKTIYLSMTNVAKTCMDSFIKVIVIDTNGGFRKTNAAYNLQVVAPATTGITSAKLGSKVTLTPTVAGDQVTVNFKGVEHEMMDIRVYGIDGKTVISASGELKGERYVLQTSMLTPGIYFARVSLGDATTLLKFVKQ
jgi:PKD repeat protein